MSIHSGAAERIGVVVIHGVGGARPGWINQDVIPHLVKCDPGLEFEDHSEVHELRAPVGRGRGTAPGPAADGEPFSSYLRRAGYGHGKNIVFMELFWADLSRVGRGWMAAFFVTLQVFYEAPLVLSAAFMRRRQHGLRRLLARLIRTANWLLRWPISGLNMSVFFAAVAMSLVEAARARWPQSPLLGIHDAYFVGGALLFIAINGIRLTRRNDDKNILRSELAPSTAISAIVLLGALIIAFQHVEPSRLEGLANYLLYASVPILLFWLVWSHIVVAGVVLVTAVWIRHLWRPHTRLGSPMRPAAALGLTMIQGVIWKIIIALTWFLLITQLEPGSIEASACAWTNRTTCSGLGRLLTELVIIVSLNLIMAGFLAITVLGIFSVRKLLVKHRVDAVRNGQMTLPRVIVSRPAVFLMFILTLLNFGVFYGPNFLTAGLWLFGFDAGQKFNVVNLARPFLVEYRMSISTAWLSIMGILAFVILTSALSGVLHIVRDLVNHQYVWTKAGKSKFSLKSPWAQFGIGIEERDEEHPRRLRILERLDLLMKEIVSREQCQRLVLIGHSQGSVILYDYLRSKWDDITLASIERIDIVTLGSPLGHIYQAYFPDYEEPVTHAGALNKKLRSWTNLWRADDPIGHHLDIIRGGFIDNIALPAGGHVDYWKDEHVCRVILDLTEHRPQKPLSMPILNGTARAAGSPPPLPMR